MKDIAIVGAGIAGLSAAYFLSRRHRVHLFEKDPRLGGHTHTVRVSSPEGELALDTGFLVHNDRTYPNLVRLFRELGVETRDSDMSFAVSCRRTGLEYSSRGASGFFADRRTLFSPSHLRLLGEIVRFNHQAPALLTEPDADGITLDEFLEARGFSAEFVDRYLLPMAAAIWSASPLAIRDFPAVTLVRFFDNHGLLTLTSQPTWKVVVNGSHSYIPLITAPLGEHIHLSAAPTAIHRSEEGATLTFADGEPKRFDHVVLACHGDRVLSLLANPTRAEQDVFAGFATSTNTAWLHTDVSVLPSRERAWASWNYMLAPDAGASPMVTYDLNRLQGLSTRERYLVTLNPPVPIDERRVIGRFVYNHPLYTRDAIRSQARWNEVSGVDRLHYCGAYWGYGFHEDGLNSALRVARALGVTW